MLVLAAALIAALPYVASAQLVRDRIALEVSAWSGYRVDLGAAPEIEVWPFRAILRDVALSGWFDPERRPVMTAEKVEIDLSPLAALRGDVVFSTARLVRPTIRLAADAGDVSFSTSPVGGRIARSIEGARTVVAADPVNPDVSALSRDPFGTIQVIDGRIVTSRGGQNEDVVTSVAGSFEWPALNRPSRLSMTGIWRGEGIALDLSTERPLVLFAGGTAPVTMNLKSAPATLAFEGTANLSSSNFFSGSARFASPSLRRMLEWSAAADAPQSPAGAVSVEGKIAGNLQRLKVEDARISIDAGTGTGVLEFAMTEQRPALAGTLAFGEVALNALLPGITAADGPASLAGGMGATLASQIDLDLRLSAEQVSAGSIKIADMAATARVKPGHVAFDISDAGAFGGNVQAGIRIDSKPEGDMVELRFLGEDVDGANIAAFVPQVRIVPAAKGNVSTMLKAPAGTWAEILANGDGTLSANFGEGVIQNFDIADLTAQLAEGGFFAFDEVSDGSLPVKGVEIKATASKGIVNVAKAELRTANSVVSLSGIIPAAGGLALSGSLAPFTEGQAEPQDGTRFFVGGSWSRPFVVPVASTAPVAD